MVARVESRDGCHAYLSSNTAKYFRESGLRVYYIGKLSSTPMYRSTRESAYRKGAAYRPLFATPSCTFKLQGQSRIGTTQSFSPAFFFFSPSSPSLSSIRFEIGSWIYSAEMNDRFPFFGSNSLKLKRNVLHAPRTNILAIYSCKHCESCNNN